MFCFLPLYYQHNSGDATVPEPAEARARARWMKKARNS